MMGSGIGGALMAAAMSGGLGGFMALASVEPIRRLLGPGVFCAEGSLGSEEQLRGTAQLVQTLLERLQREPSWHHELQQLGAQRIGSGGGTARMAADLHQLLQQRIHG